MIKCNCWLLNPQFAWSKSHKFMVQKTLVRSFWMLQFPVLHMFFAMWILSGSQTWQLEMSELVIEVSSWANQLYMGDFPASHVWLPGDPCHLILLLVISHYSILYEFISNYWCLLPPERFPWNMIPLTIINHLTLGKSH